MTNWEISYTKWPVENVLCFIILINVTYLIRISNLHNIHRMPSASVHGRTDGVRADIHADKHSCGEVQTCQLPCGPVPTEYRHFRGQTRFIVDRCVSFVNLNLFSILISFCFVFTFVFLFVLIRFYVFNNFLRFYLTI